ncbi:hypothetical protein FHG87_009655 [Trinorchestia longiramus]|nr:hypothetical protein FHG87_009655 [Trinorchestia longiramus]
MNNFGSSGTEPPYPGYSLPTIALQEGPMLPGQMDGAAMRGTPQGGRRKKKKQRGGGRGGRGGGRGGGSGGSSSGTTTAGPWPEDRQQATATSEENSSAARELEEQQQQQLTDFMTHILDQKKMELLKNPTIQRFIDLKQRQMKP